MIKIFDNLANSSNLDGIDAPNFHEKINELSHQHIRQHIHEQHPQLLAEEKEHMAHYLKNEIVSHIRLGFNNHSKYSEFSKNEIALGGDRQSLAELELKINEKNLLNAEKNRELNKLETLQSDLFNCTNKPSSEIMHVVKKISLATDTYEEKNRDASKQKESEYVTPSISKRTP